MRSKNDYWDYLEHSRSHKYIKRTGTPGNYKYIYPEDLERSDYDGMTRDERVAQDRQEYAMYKNMPYEKQKAYEQKIRDRQMKYIDEQSKHLSNRKTKDGQYDIRDKVREQVTGKMDGDHIERRRQNQLEDSKGHMVANNRWGEELEAKHRSKYVNENLVKEISGFEDQTIRGRIRRLRRKKHKR